MQKSEIFSAEGIVQRQLRNHSKLREPGPPQGPWTGVQQCTYIKRAGSRCTNLGYNCRCHFHKNSTSHSLCHNGCGRGTLSITGYCKQCDELQDYYLQRRRQQAKLQRGDQADAEAKQKKLEAEWDAYIDECIKSADLVIDLTTSAQRHLRETTRIQASTSIIA